MVHSGSGPSIYHIIPNWQEFQILSTRHRWARTRQNGGQTARRLFICPNSLCGNLHHGQFLICHSPFVLPIMCWRFSSSCFVSQVCWKAQRGHFCSPYLFALCDGSLSFNINTGVCFLLFWVILLAQFRIRASAGHDAVRLLLRNLSVGQQRLASYDDLYAVNESSNAGAFQFN